MTAPPARTVQEAAWQRRARPLLGTLVEVGVRTGTGSAEAAFEAAFGAILAVQQGLSRFDPGSDLSRFHALPCGGRLRMRPVTQAVLAAAQELQLRSDGLFDISLGTAPQGWHCAGPWLHKLQAGTQLDAGGIAKGHAVDQAVHALQALACPAGWVNAGGDLRVFGDLLLPVHLRDEAQGGVRHFADIAQGAFATSHFGTRSRSALAGEMGLRPAQAHVSVAAPLCLWADALTKVLALRGDAAPAMLAPYQAQAWWH